MPDRGTHTEPSESYRTWRRFYNMARRALSVERSEFYADRLYHDYVNRIDTAPIFAQLDAEIRASVTG